MLELTTGATAETLADLLRVQPRHLRSTQLERDFGDAAATSHYVVTPFTAATLRRLLEGLRIGSTARAWRLTGDYGTGKSSLALVLSHLAAGMDDGIPEELADLRTDLRLEPVLVVGDREPIGKGVLRALRALVTTHGLDDRRKSLRNLLDLPEPAPTDVVDAVERVADAVRGKGLADGLLLVLDELGKNLEYAVRAPQSEDVYLLQRLAEAAARSGERPLMVVAILHQGVATYAATLPSGVRREWEKVAGRFEEVVFAPPIEQTATLIAAALDVDRDAVPPSLSDEAETTMAAAISAGWYGAGAPTGSLEALAGGLLPLDPFTLPVLARLLRRYGQNERSLFSFLSSGEPFGLMEHARMPLGRARPFRLHDLYDYVSANLVNLIEHGVHSSRWQVIDGVVRSAAIRSDAELQVLKTVGILNLLDDPALPAAESAIRRAVAGASEDAIQAVTQSIARLRDEARILYARGAIGGLSLWPNSSVDLAEAFARATEATAGAGVVPSLLPLLPRDPLVARRHYVETGALRDFERVYATVGDMEAAVARPLDNGPQAPDGRIVVVLSENAREREEALGIAGRLAATLTGTVLLAVPEPVGDLAPLIEDVRAWRWVRESVAELAGDRIARQEVDRQIATSEDRLGRALSSLTEFRSGGGPTEWFHGGGAVALPDGRAVVSYLSTVCDRAFDLSPIVRNELINRRTLSTAAARARYVLLEALSTHADVAGLGIDDAGTPPERAMYLSILRPGGVHAERNGAWSIDLPPEGADPLRLRPALVAIDAKLREAGDARVPYEDLISLLRGGRYGIRDGLAPLFVAIYLAARWHHTAVYEDGSYLDQVGGPEFNRLIKEPEHFELQHCAIEGVRAEVFARLAVAIGIEEPAATLDLLDVVRPLTTFVARLPDYARRTRGLSAITVAVREALLSARDPKVMVFSDLPRACGLDPISVGEQPSETDVDRFMQGVRSAVRELRDAYGALLARLAAALAAALEIDEDEPAAIRGVAGLRASRVMAAVKEPELKAFLLRLADRALDDAAWLEALASTVARKPAERWTDMDEAEFAHRLPQLAKRFRRVEAAAYDEATRTTLADGDEAYRVVVTAADGREVEEVLRLGAGDQALLASIEEKMRKLLAKHGRLGTLAAARVIMHEGQTDD